MISLLATSFGSASGFPKTFPCFGTIGDKEFCLVHPGGRGNGGQLRAVRENGTNFRFLSLAVLLVKEIQEFVEWRVGATEPGRFFARNGSRRCRGQGIGIGLQQGVLVQRGGSLLRCLVAGIGKAVDEFVGGSRKKLLLVVVGRMNFKCSSRNVIMIVPLMSLLRRGEITHDTRPSNPGFDGRHQDSFATTSTTLFLLVGGTDFGHRIGGWSGNPPRRQGRKHGTEKDIPVRYREGVDLFSNEPRWFVNKKVGLDQDGLQIHAP
mmetsp:Transcript_2686/g.7469  ORF Transcript_2686/g.7469 Transcript_2686/m.7469 type:complete len:264 (+) Transcript_2686:383-1174(+)